MKTNDCIHCGKCLSVCPLVRATDREELGPRSKSVLCNTLAQDTDLTPKKVAALARLCLGCERCTSVCSRGVGVPGIVAELRANHPKFLDQLYRLWMKQSKLLWPIGTKASGLVPEALVPERFGPMLKMLDGLEEGPGIEPFLKPEQFPDTYQGEKMLLFSGCTATMLRSRWQKAALGLLDGLGVDLLPSEFGCCGHSLKLAGGGKAAHSMEEHNMDVWRAAGKPRVVVFCGSCMSGLKDYADVARDDEELAQWLDSLTPLSSLVRDTHFLIQDNAPESIGFHRPCHGGMEDDYRLVEEAVGDRLKAATDKECCGFGGVMRLGDPKTADMVNAQCWQRLQGTDVVLTGCSACAIQLSGSAPEDTKAAHWLETIV